MEPRFDRCDVNSVLEIAGFENKSPVYDVGRRALGSEGGFEIHHKEASGVLRTGRGGIATKRLQA